MVDITKDILEQKKKFKCTEVVAPGALELAALARNKLMNDYYDGVIFLGIVIRGETSHYDLVTQEAYRSIGKLAYFTYNRAVINNVICVENIEQLEARLVKNTTKNAKALIKLINEKSS
tara:strand:+ start:134 stop:490 length:357 start_codon:yes stop_codon:yes gene_type:complete